MTKLRIAVVRGGPSNEAEVSLKTGATVLKHLNRDRFTPTDVFIDKTGQWHFDGAPGGMPDLRHRADVVWNALHGAYGEDGTLQRELDEIGMPYTGSGVFASALAMHKDRAKKVFVDHGLSVAPGMVVNVSDITDATIRDIFRSLSLPLVVKPMHGGSSVGMSVVYSLTELYEALERAAALAPPSTGNADEILIESMIRGREATCGVVEDYRGEKHYALMPVEIVSPKDQRFFSYDAKYSGESSEICPGRFSREETLALQDAARRAHIALGARHYSRSDFIVTPRGVYILETNTLPGLTEESLVPKSLEAAGCSLAEFLEHIIERSK